MLQRMYSKIEIFEDHDGSKLPSAERKVFQSQEVGNLSDNSIHHLIDDESHWDGKLGGGIGYRVSGTLYRRNFKFYFDAGTNSPMKN